MSKRPKPRTYTPEQKIAAVEAVRAQGLADAARSTGVPRRSLFVWAKAAGVATGDPSKTDAARKMLAARVDKKRQELREALLDRAIDLNHRMDKESPVVPTKGPHAGELFMVGVGADECKHYATALAICIDKFRLESGEHTTYEKHDPAGIRHAFEAQMDELAKRRASKTG